ncbi:MAG: hypothetical protein LBK40_09290, partial [Spirochaetaceae bacterium]|nr:hypothetical protein [Spirochaetaceae bacterium]
PALSTIGPVPETAPSEPLAGTREAAREAGTELFPARLAQYTPLRRAVLMAEILGQPKGLDC